MEGIELNGRCKEDFEKWYFITTEYSKRSDIWFPNLPFSMQFGIYVDFFDSVGIDINMFQTPINCFRMYIKVNGKVVYNPIREQNEGAILKTRTEARQKAIEKANEIYNEL